MYEQDDLEQGGTTTQDSQNLADVLRNYDLPEEIIERAKNETMIQSGYTRVRQQETARMRELENQLAYLMGQQAAGGPGKQPQDEVEAFLQEFNDGSPQSEAMLKVLRGLADQMEKRVEKKFAANLAPVEHSLKQSKVDSDLRNYQTRFREIYGDEAFALIPTDRWHDYREHLLRGGQVDPRADLLNDARLAPKFAQCVLRQEDRKRENRASRHLDGMTQTSRTSPPQHGGNHPVPKGGINSDAMLRAEIVRKFRGAR